MDRIRRSLIAAALLLGSAASAIGQPQQPTLMDDYPIVPVPFHQVRVEDGFWGPRFRTNRQVTIPYDFAKCEETGRIDNFAKAGGLMEGPHKGQRYDDSDVFKVIEGAAYSLATHPDPALEAYLDELISKIAAAQEADGYLFTARTIDPHNLPPNSGEARWSYLRHSHELYNVGHLYEAAVAHHLVTGKRNLLDVALKNAELVLGIFGSAPGQLREVPGHQEIEIGLIRLYRLTGDRRYFDLARFFLDERGHANGRELGGEYNQDHAPVLEQAEAVGHAVRAIYMYMAMADVAALTDDADYRAALDRLWQDVAGRKMYITGGVGSRRGGESFGTPYELPNETAYNETCAAVANALWNHRMFLLTGDARYLDVLERVIYNGFLSGVSLEGDRFFYPNPLAWDGQDSFNFGHAGRSPWFNTSCCPVNVARFIPSIAGYVYATRPGEEGRLPQLFVNLFVAGSARIQLGEQVVHVAQETQYPWDGEIRISVDPEQPAEFALRVRIPGWAGEKPVPTDLYRYLEQREPRPVQVQVNGEPVSVDPASGFAQIQREWKRGDEVRLTLPMQIRRVVADERVEADRGRVALERGPVVYCLEAIDHGGRVSGLAIPDDAELSHEWRPDLLGGVVVLRGEAMTTTRLEDGKIATEPKTITAVPYYAWAHREPGEMAVWLPRSAETASAPPGPPSSGATAQD